MYNLLNNNNMYSLIKSALAEIINADHFTNKYLTACNIIYDYTNMDYYFYDYSCNITNIKDLDKNYLYFTTNDFFNNNKNTYTELTLDNYKSLNSNNLFNYFYKYEQVPYIRKGQLLFTATNHVYPKLTTQFINGHKKLDCFYDDNKYDNLINYLKLTDRI